MGKYQQECDYLAIIAKQADAIERLNAQVAMFLEVWEQAEISISAFVGDEGWGSSDIDNLDAVSAALYSVRNSAVTTHWIAAHDAKVRDDALEEVAKGISNGKYTGDGVPLGLVAKNIRLTKGTK